MTSIGEYAFYCCDNLTSIKVAEDNAKYDSRGNCNAIIETATNTLIIGCKNAVIPNSVTSIGISAFEGCDLTSIVIPNSVTEIGSKAFSMCKGLTSITIPNRVTSINNNTFEYCRGLTTVNIPSGMKLIGSCAFYECSNLTSVIVKARTPPTCVFNSNYGHPFSNRSNATLYVPKGCKNYYQNSMQGWGGFKEIIEME